MTEAISVAETVEIGPQEEQSIKKSPRTVDDDPEIKELEKKVFSQLKKRPLPTDCDEDEEIRELEALVLSELRQSSQRRLQVAPSTATTKVPKKRKKKAQQQDKDEKEKERKMPKLEICSNAKLDTIRMNSLLASSRSRRSLGTVVLRFIELLPHFPKTEAGEPLFSVKLASDTLCVEVRRVYDIINSLEAIDLVRKVSRRTFVWCGVANIVSSLARLKAVGLKDCLLDRFRQLVLKGLRWKTENCAATDARFREALEYVVPGMNLVDVASASPPKVEALNGHDYQPSGDFSDLYKQESILSKFDYKRDPDDKDNVGAQDNAGDQEQTEIFNSNLVALTQRFLILTMLMHPDPLPMEHAAWFLVGLPTLDDKMGTRYRRLYDIANVASSLTLVKKVQWCAEAHMQNFHRKKNDLAELTGDEELKISSPAVDDCCRFFATKKPGFVYAGPPIPSVLVERHLRRLNNAAAEPLTKIGRKRAGTTPTGRKRRSRGEKNLLNRGINPKSTVDNGNGSALEVEIEPLTLPDDGGDSAGVFNWPVWKPSFLKPPRQSDSWKAFLSQKGPTGSSGTVLLPADRSTGSTFRLPTPSELTSAVSLEPKKVSISRGAQNPASQDPEQYLSRLTRGPISAVGGLRHQPVAAPPASLTSQAKCIQLSSGSMIKLPPTRCRSLGSMGQWRQLAKENRLPLAHLHYDHHDDDDD